MFAAIDTIILKVKCQIVEDLLIAPVLRSVKMRQEMVKEGRLRARFGNAVAVTGNWPQSPRTSQGDDAGGYVCFVSQPGVGKPDDARIRAPPTMWS
jgi:hypothetical protein